jgi:hypothetical protein
MIKQDFDRYQEIFKFLIDDNDLSKNKHESILLKIYKICKDFIPINILIDLLVFNKYLLRMNNI